MVYMQNIETFSGINYTNLYWESNTPIYLHASKNYKKTAVLRILMDV